MENAAARLDKSNMTDAPSESSFRSIVPGDVLHPPVAADNRLH